MNTVLVVILTVTVVITVVVATVIIIKRRKSSGAGSKAGVNNAVNANSSWVLAMPQGHAIFRNSHPFTINSDGTFSTKIAAVNGLFKYDVALNGWGSDSGGNLIINGVDAGTWAKIPNKNGYNLMNTLGQVFEVLLTKDECIKAASGLKNYYPFLEGDLCSKPDFEVDDWVACVTYGALYVRFANPFKMDNSITLHASGNPDINITLNGWGGESGTLLVDKTTSGTWKKVNIGGLYYIYPLTFEGSTFIVLTQACVYEKMLNLFWKAFPLNDLCS